MHLTIINCYLHFADRRWGSNIMILWPCYIVSRSYLFVRHKLIGERLYNIMFKSLYYKIVLTVIQMCMRIIL